MFTALHEWLGHTEAVEVIPLGHYDDWPYAVWITNGRSAEDDREGTEIARCSSQQDAELVADAMRKLQILAKNRVRGDELSASLRFAVTLQIDNIYEDGENIQTIVQTEVDSPPTVDEDDDEREDWLQENIFEHTGTGKEKGNAGYFVTVTKSARPDLIPVGTEYEFC